MWKLCFKTLKADDNFKRLLRNGLSLLSANTVVSLLQFSQVIVLTRFLLPEGYGIFTLVVVYVEIINEFFDMRVELMTVQFGSKYLSRKDSSGVVAIIKLSYIVDSLTGILAFIVVFLTVPWATHIVFQNATLEPLIRLYTICLLFGTLKGTNDSVLRILNYFTWISVYAVTVATVEFLSVTIALALGKGVKGVLMTLIYLEVLRLCSSTALAFAALQRRFGWSLLRNAPIGSLKGQFGEIGKFLLHTNVFGYIRMINTQIDVLILGHFRPASELGMYRFARGLANVVVRITDPFAAAILPDLGRLWATSRIREYQALLRKSFVSMVVVLVPLAVVLSAMSKILCRFLAGNAYVQAAPSFIVCLGAFTIGAVFFWAWPAAISMQRADYGTWVGIIGCILQVIFALALVPRIGGMGTAIALLSTYVVGQPLLAWLTQKQVQNRKCQLEYAL